MTALQPIAALAGDFARSQPRGQVGRLEMLPVSALRVDDTYQRAVTVGSVKNIKRICAEFDWAKFLPVIVTQSGDDYCIVDGQHRTTAAATLGITNVPCYVLACSPAEAAGAFAAINGNVTPVRPVDLWFAELAAQAPKALALQRVLDAAGVKVIRRKDNFAVGETSSITVLRRAFNFYGSALLTTILQCITETGGGNAGLIIGSVVNGVGMAIRTKPDLLANPSRLFDLFDAIDLNSWVYQAKIEYARSGNAPQFILTRKINAKLRGDGDGA